MNPRKEIKWIVDEKTGCHNCISHYKSKQSYARITRNKKTYNLHRYIWEQKNGNIIFKRDICHKCDNPSCINIAHLFLGTRSDNMLDSVKKGRARCLRTHGENSYLHKFTKEQIIEIRTLKILTQLPNYKIAKIYNVASSTIDRIINKKTWKHVGGGGDGSNTP